MWQPWEIWYHQLKGHYKSWYQSAAGLRAYQQNKINKLLEHTSSHIRFYQSYKRATLYDYPIIDKPFVQEHFASLNQAQLTSRQVMQIEHSQAIEVHQSLGTAGIPGIYLYSTYEKIASFGNVLSKMFPKLFWKSKKIAAFHLSTEPYFATKFSTWKMNWLLLDLHRPFSELVKELQNFQPEVLVGSVQTLCELAKLQLSGKISLRCYHIVSTAEVLTPLAESLIKRAFQQDIHQLYQCAEGSLGMTCKYGTMHLNEDEFYIEKEWIDHKRQRFVPVITTLKRALHPLIRYRMEDILVLRNSPCLCGNPSLAVDKIVGRCEDVLYFKQRMNSGLKPIYADTFNQVLSEVVPFVHQYQILQHSMRYLVIKILVDDFTLAENAMIKQLHRLWELELVQPPQLEFVRLESTRFDQMFRMTKRLEKTTVPF